MRKIALPEEGIETLYGARDANLRHIESLLSVHIRTQGSELTVQGDPGDEQRAQLIFDQLGALMNEGYPLAHRRREDRGAAPGRERGPRSP